MLKIRTIILSDEVPLAEDGFHWRLKGRKGVIYYVKSGKLLPIYAEVPTDTEQFDIIVFGQTKHLRFWQFPDEKPISNTESDEIYSKLMKWLGARRWKHEVI